MGILLDGSNCYYKVFTAVDVPTIPFSVACWFKSDLGAGDKAVWALSSSLGNADYYNLVRSGITGQLIWSLSHPGGSIQAISNKSIADSNWHHGIGISAKTNDHRVYLDGVRGPDSSTEGTVGIGGSPIMTIGARKMLSQAAFWKGTIAWVTVWNAVLTDAEALALSNGLYPLHIKSNLIAYYWPCYGDGPITAQVRDMVGNKNLTSTEGIPSKADSIILTNEMPKW